MIGGDMCDMIKNLNNTAFSLLEILLASIIFIITIGGIFATLNAVRVPVADKESALTAAVFGKQVLEALRSQVSDQASANFYVTCSGTCADFSLALGTHQISVATLSSVNLTWPQVLVTGENGNHPNGNPPVLNYNVSCADGSSCTNTEVAHKVNLNINY
jgi:Tfp pilus assembly protein PilV